MLSKKARKAFHAFWKIANAEQAIWPQKRKLLSRKDRESTLESAGYNLFRIPSHAVYIDLLTDSGTSRMSEAQWMGMLEGDESYAGSESWKRLKQKIQDVFGFPYVLPVHQGRAGERVFFETVISPRQKYVIGNTPFDTTRHWIERSGGEVIDCLPGPKNFYDWRRDPFFGDMDLEKFSKALRAHAKKIACVLITITCNSAGGHPVGLENIRRARKLTEKYGVPLFLDAARYAENAYFNQLCIGRYLDLKSIIQDAMAAADGILVSAKKDCMANIGGFIALNNEALYKKLKPHVTAQEGYADGYGGMAGYTMESIARGIEESLDETYLKERIELHRRLQTKLNELGIPALPAGGHGVFVNAGEFLPHIPWHEFPGYALALELFLEGGIRSVEVGSLMLGRDPKTGKNRQALRELTRLAFPRRVYGWKDCERIITAFRAITKRKSRTRGVMFAEGGESEGMRHFDSVFRRISVSEE
ncbi:MAG: tryptophanase [bacterium]|nr:tryptophanase [bacterium]